MISLSQIQNEFEQMRSSFAREDVQHIQFEKDHTVLFLHDKNRIYKPSITGAAFGKDDTFVQLVMGAYGSGKSTMCIHKIVEQACKMPKWHNNRRKSKWLIIRNTSGELQSTTLQTWLTWFGELGVIKKRQKPLLTYEHTFNDGHGIIELELVFIALDRDEDIRKLKSIEATGAYINELSEVPQAVLHHLIGRVNHRYPSHAFCNQPYWSGIICDTNPPDEDHWIYKDFELNPTENYKIFHQPSGLKLNEDGTLLKDIHHNYIANPLADNYENLSPDYYVKLSEKRSEGFIKVYCVGRYGIVESGKRVYPEYNDDIHSAQNVVAIQGIPIHLCWDFGLCYSDDTEVLTNNGWKLFKDVNEHVDLAATRNPKTKEMEFTLINFKVDFDYEGELLEWASTEVNFCVTPEHKVPFQSAQWLAEHHSGHHYVDVCSEWKPNFDYSIKYFGMKAHEFAEFMGLYLSEGSVYKVGNSYRISIYQNNQNPIMQEILNKTGLNWVYRFKDDCGVWTVTDNSLGLYLKSFGISGNKFAPQEIKDMPANELKAFIYSYTAGDGHIRIRPNGASEHTIATKSIKMRDDLQEIVQKCGWNSSYRWQKPQLSIINENGTDRIISGEGVWVVTIKKRAKRAELLRRNFRKVKYKGKIYCLNVPYHVLYIRINGKPSWNGNTPACVVFQLTARGRILILKEYLAEDMGIRTFAQNVVLPSLPIDFPYNKIGASEADPAGMASDGIMEELSCIGELTSLGIPTNPAHTNDPLVRISSVRYFLNTMIDGQPALQLNREGCPVLRKGFVNGYHFKRLSISGDERFHEKPNKNRFSHPHDALQYGLMKFASDRIMDSKKDDKPPIDIFNPVVQWVTGV